jgi:hypothetical protein
LNGACRSSGGVMFVVIVCTIDIKWENERYSMGSIEK